MAEKDLTTDLLSEILLLMNSEIKIFLTTIIGAILGILEATGHLDSATGNQFQTDLTVAGGTLVTLISIIVLFYHQLLVLENDLKGITWEEPTTNATTTTTTITAPTPPANG